MTMDEFPGSILTTEYLSDPQIHGNGFWAAFRLHLRVLDTYPIREVVARIGVQDLQICLAARTEMRRALLMRGPDLFRALNIASGRSEERGWRFMGNDLPKRCRIAADVSARDAQSCIHKFHEIRTFCVHVTALIETPPRKNVYGKRVFRENERHANLPANSRPICIALMSVARDLI